MRQRLSVPSSLPRATLSLVLACCATGAWSQTTTFSTPGSFTYPVPVGTGSLQVVVKGAAGGAGGWDDGPGGDGVGGTEVKATIAVQGGETVNLVVGEGGEGTLGTGKNGMRGRQRFSSGGAGGGDGTRQDPGSLTSPLAGAGGRGGDSGLSGSSPGGAGGGGASQLTVNSAAITAGGGGGGGSQSVNRDPVTGNWGYPASSAVNTLVLNQQDAGCATLAVGQNGEGEGPFDGSGGSGGGGAYTGQAGAGGKHGVDRSGNNGEPGGSGASCVLDAGSYKVVLASTALGAPSIAAKTKGVSNPSGENGSITITAIPAPPNMAPTVAPVLGGVATVGSSLSGSYTFADAETDAENTTGAGSQFVLVRSAAPGLTASAQGVAVLSGPTTGAAQSYVLAAADENQYLSYCVTPVAVSGTAQGVEVCSSALGPVSKATVTPPGPGPTANATPVPVWGMLGWLMASLGLGGMAAGRIRRRASAGI